MEQNFKLKGVSSIVIILVVLIILGGLGFLGWKLFGKKEEGQPATSESSKVAATWQEKGVAISGQYADADVVDIGGGKFRMYYSVEPEVPNNKLELYSATSTDGENWTKEPGVRKEFATFPDVLKLSENKYRLYYQNAGVIKSAISEDGLSWQDEDGVRISDKKEGFSLENVGAQSTTRLEDGTYLMVYRGMIKEKYSSEVPNENTQIFFYATSKDGLNFEKKGIALDSRNTTFNGLLDGAEWQNWDDGKLRLYFWSYQGIYHSVFEDGKFSEPVFDFTNNTDSKAKFSPNPPSDPTLANIANQWFIYYGQHTKGIYYAVLNP